MFIDQIDNILLSWLLKKTLSFIFLFVFEGYGAHLTLDYHCPILSNARGVFRYLYADLYSGALWAATEDPENSGNFSTSTIPFGCARDSPIQCSTVPESALAALGYIFSFGEDNSKNIYLLTSSGVYRVVPPSRCNYTCSMENGTAVASPSPTTSPPSHANRLSPVILLSALLMLLIGLA